MGASATGRVTVFSREGCVQRNATYRALDHRGVDYRILDVDELCEGAAEELRALGFTRLPVVQVPGTPAWSGSRPDLIAEIDPELVNA